MFTFAVSSEISERAEAVLSSACMDVSVLSNWERQKLCCVFPRKMRRVVPTRSTFLEHGALRILTETN